VVKKFFNLRLGVSAFSVRVEAEETRSGNVADAVLIEAVEHAQEDFGCGERIASRAVTVKNRNGEVFCDGVQAIVEKTWKNAARELDRAETRISHPASGKDARNFVIQKARVELRIVRD
jgi:hypothetical protein